MNATGNGLTLIELLITLAIGALLLGVAWPSLAQLVSDQRRVSTVNGLVSSLNHARHAAITTRRIVTVCASEDGQRCGDDWQEGWVSFTEPSGWKPGDAVPPDAILRHHPAVRGAPVLANRARFRFRPNNRRAINGTLVVCDARGTGSAIVISHTGRVRTTRDLPAWAVAPCRGEAG